MVSGLVPAPGKSLAIVSETTRELWLEGSTPASMPVQWIPRAGTATTSISRVAARAVRPGRCITARASAYQRPAPSAARCTLPSLRASSRSSGGSSSRVTAAAASATAAPPMPIETRNRWGKTVRQAMAAATVTALNETVRPALLSVAARALPGSAPGWPSSSRNRETNSRL